MYSFIGKFTSILYDYYKYEGKKKINIINSRDCYIGDTEYKISFFFSLSIFFSLCSKKKKN